MTHTPDELRTLVDALHECLPTAEDGPDHRTYAMVLGSDLRKAHDILRQLADAKPVATVTGCAEVDEKGIPLYARDLDWNQSEIESLPVGTPLYAAPVAAAPAMPGVTP
jgi:hypothetical protein